MFLDMKFIMVHSCYTMKSADNRGDDACTRKINSKTKINKMNVEDVTKETKVTKEEQEVLFEEELRKSQYSDSDESSGDEDNTNDGDNKNCKLCYKLMSRMRRTAVRWLYMEWYKKAVLGQSLPTISELTPTLANVLKSTEIDPKNKIYSSNTRSIKCYSCHTEFESLISNTLQPISTLSEMYSSLPRNWTATTSTSDGNIVSNTNHDAAPNCDLQFSKLSPPYYISHGEDVGLNNCKEKEENATPAASFFYRAAQKLNLASRPKSKKSKRKKEETEMGNNRYVFPTNFSDLIMKRPPQAPQTLFKHGTIRRGDGHGKVRLVLRINNRKNKLDTCLTVDAKKKQVLLRESTTTTPSANTSENHKRFEKAPRLYSFDNVFDKTCAQADLCSGTLVDLLHTVVNGNDACLLTYGYPKLGKSSIMIGKDDRPENIGIIPCAISWLYQLIDDRKERTGARFSIRVSAVEVVGKSENLKDLLGEQGNSSVCSSVTSPSVYLPRERACSVQLSDFTELRAPNAEKAAFFFDAAVAAKTTPHPVYDEDGELLEDPEERKNSNMIFTLHVYQYMIDKVGTGEIHGGRSRFHLIDLSGCSRKKRSRDTGQGSWLPLSALGNVIASLANGTKHIPHRDSKLTTLLREAMGSLSSRVTIVANVSEDQKHCFETLSTLQLTSRIHRSRKKKSRYSSTSSSGGDSSCDERRKQHNHKRRCKPVTPLLRTEACQSDNVGESEFTSTSAAEESCDTVIYVGPQGGAISDRELTDFEHPPSISTKHSSHAQSITVPRLKKAIKKDENCNILLKTDCNMSVLKPNDCKSKLKKLPIKQIEKPIVVTINDTMLKSPLEEKSSLVETKRQQKFQDDTWLPCINQTELIDNWKTENNYSESLPVREKNRCYSIPMAVATKPKRTSSLRLNRTKNDNRQCASTNSSPCKQAYNENNIVRSSSVDRALYQQTETAFELRSDYKSTDTVSSVGTVQNFERQLVSKIAERFALEDEFDYVDDVDQEFFTQDNAGTNGVVGEHYHSGEEFFIDDDLESIGVELDIDSPLGVQNTYNHSSNLISHSKTLLEESEQRENDVIICNNCIGECKCEVSHPKSYWIPLREYDSAEDTDERTNEILRLKSLRNRISFSSCDSHLDHTSTQNYGKRAPSEGVSSGYESMRWESNANIHVSGESSNEKGKSTKKEKKNSTIYECRDEALDSSFDDDDKEKTHVKRTIRHQRQIKELIERRQDLKEELHQTLKKLVLNRVPLPDIDDHLHEISENTANKEILVRANRILEKKVKVCRTHLQLVNSFENNPLQSPSSPSSTTTPKKKNPYQRLSAKIKSKLGKNSPKKSFKVTSV